MALVYHIELTNVCDLTCSYCSLTTSERTKGYMSEETFQKIVTHMQRLTPLNLMILHHFGEPLLHPNLERFVEIADRARLNPGFSTNGEKLDRDRFVELVTRGLKWLCIAFHTPKGEEMYHELVDLAREAKILYWGRKLTKEPEPYDLNALFDYGIEKQLLHSFAGVVAEEVPKPPGWTPPCDFLERNFVCVLHDGRVVPCAMDEKAVEVLGTVDDLDAIQQKPSYELCRTCQGFKFYESFRGGMKRVLEENSKAFEDHLWIPHVSIDDRPQSWKTKTAAPEAES